MIDLYYYPTPNGFKITIMLEECGLPYALKKVDIQQGEQFRPEFLAINPNNKIPAIVDHDALGDRWRFLKAARSSSISRKKQAGSCRPGKRRGCGCCNGCSGKSAASALRRA